MNVRRIGSLIVVLAVTLGVAPSATAQSDSASPAVQGKTTFVVGTTEDITSANPFAATSTGTDYEMLFLSYDMLLNFDQSNLQPAPGIASSWEASKDGSSYTFHIRKGMTWSDGKPVTANDVAFTYNFIWNAQGGTGAFKNYLGDPASFTAPDPYTFVWKMKTPTMAPITPPYIPILPEHIWKPLYGASASAIKGFDAMPQVGSGPFKLVQWVPGQFVRFEARDSYWMGTPHVDDVVFRIFDNQEAMVQAFKQGEVDAVHYLDPTIYNSLQGQPGIQTLETSPSRVYNLAFNLTPPSLHPDTTGSKALQDPLVRQAIAYAMNKQQLVDKLLGGHAQTADSFILPIFSRWYLPAPANLQYSYNMDKAKQLMDQAGYVDTNGDGIREFPGTKEPLTFNLLVLSNDTNSSGAGQYVKEWMTELGWKVNLKVLTPGKITSLWGTGDYDAYIWYWTGDPDPNFMLSIFTTGQCRVWSDTCWSNPQYDALYKQQQAQTDLATRQGTVDQMQTMYYQQVPEVMLFYTLDLQAVRSDKWTGFQRSPQPGGGYIYGWGPFTYLDVQPRSGAATTSSSGGEAGGSKAFVWVGAAVLLFALALVILRRRRRRVEDES